MRHQDTRGTLPNDLERIENQGEIQLSRDQADPRGYDLYGRDDQKIGTVKGLLASRSTKQPYFAIVDTGNGSGHKQFAIPLECLGVNELEHKAYGPFTREQFQAAPEYRVGGGDYHTAWAYWSGLRASDAAWQSASAATGEVRVPVREETAQVRKEQRQVGEVGIRKEVEVETQHISEPVTHTRVVAERRAVPPGEQYQVDPNAATLREGETVRVPVVKEELKVEKVPRVTEEVVIRQETETEQVERDVQLRRERVEIEEEGEAEVETTRPRRT
jgi:uncharacterized protein (TIGR02271 family)